MTKSKLRVYFCGGTGANIGRKVPANVCDPVFVDTSTSNARNLPKDSLFLVEGMDGSGKKQSVTYENFKTIANDVLIKFKPSDELNIVLSSTSGGSGSVMAPVLAGRLMEMGKNVIVIGIESKTSLIETKNALSTLKNYKGVSSAQKKCLSLFYISNMHKSDADDRAVWFIELMSLIIDKSRTEELDVSDISNFINFDRVTPHSPNVALIVIGENVAYIPEKNTAVVATIHVSTSRTTDIEAPAPDYLAKCVVTDDEKGSLSKDIRIDNLLGLHAYHFDQLTSIIKARDDERQVNKVADIANVNTTSDGMSCD